ncbi:hypothetical protein PTKIN_Ptkin03bG0120000 [Pterospermum kingtungense]
MKRIVESAPSFQWLTYAMVITKILEHEGIDLVSYHKEKLEFDHITHESLKHCGYKKVNGVWVKRGQEFDEEEHENEENIHDETDTSRAHEGSSTKLHAKLDTLIEKFHAFRIEVREELSAIQK